MTVPLPILLFFITLGVEILSWIGHSKIATYCHNIKTIFSPTPHSKQQRVLKADILKLKSELAATSAQSEFAKWAKLRRKLDKGVADLENLTAQTSSASTANFTRLITSLLWIVTTAGPFILTSYHRKAAVIYLPPGWFGGLTWFLSLPGAPLGGIACGVWTMACKRVIGQVKSIVVDFVAADPVPPPPPAPATMDEKKEVPVKDEL
ncbi:protein of CHD5-like protein family [Pseudohyphozyma bogoriensis]|nr:protein of CHD5-like protein family [Pseudohyphozyma bogoriensis]